MTFFTALEEKQREELLLSYNFFSPLAAFIKAADNCCDLEAFTAYGTRSI